MGAPNGAACADTDINCTEDKDRQQARSRQTPSVNLSWALHQDLVAKISPIGAGDARGSLRVDRAERSAVSVCVRFMVSRQCGAPLKEPVVLGKFENQRRSWDRRLICMHLAVAASFKAGCRVIKCKVRVAFLYRASSRRGSKNFSFLSSARQR